jgi:hypothetical protein
VTRTIEPVGVAEPDDIGSNTSGLVFGVRATTKAVLADARADAFALASLQQSRLRRAARRWPRRRVLALAVERIDVPSQLESARAELLRSRHSVTFASTAAADRGRFENLNTLLQGRPALGHDWLLVIDDDVTLPRGFLDAFIFLAERFQLRLAQPAHRERSHAGWQITRRRLGVVARETRFVEIGPVVAFQHVTFNVLLPFPALRFGWGLDLHWSAVAARSGWRIGVLDAAPIRHSMRLTATSYDRRDAVAEAKQFLAHRPYTKAADAQQTLVTHRSWK